VVEAPEKEDIHIRMMVGIAGDDDLVVVQILRMDCEADRRILHIEDTQGIHAMEEEDPHTLDDACKLAEEGHDDQVVR
jgi:hypothetical protein